MEALNSIFSIIIGIISIFYLIRFFDMAADVRKIKDKLYPSMNDYVMKAHEEKYVGNTGKAKEFYLRARYMVETSKLKEKRKKYYLENIDKAINDL